ncbi:MAG: hypothetical protein M1833_004259 [Piccolia ochrophora]|nr:MAG: hypothetical protein M1833_004259 [Piccolia ochrophora]
MSPESEAWSAKEMYQATLQQYGSRVLPPSHPYSRTVRRVMGRLIPSTGLQDTKWEVYVIDDPEQTNAFVIPGGKVFVFSGILPICDGDDGLAAVLGHEIAHNIARHQSERMSQQIIFISVCWLLSSLFEIPDILNRILLDVAFAKPGSRQQELEADYIGLMMMAQSCYDPEAAVGLWDRMNQAEKYAPPQWLSTHPSSLDRKRQIGEWLPEAEAKRSASDCAATLGYAQEFRDTFRQVVW